MRHEKIQKEERNNSPLELVNPIPTLTEESLESYIHNLEQLQQAMLKLGLIEVAAAIQNTLQIAGEYLTHLKR